MSEAPEVPNRIPITAAVMLATLMTSLDSTIVNVALPHIQGSLSASTDQIGWVLTSYIVATAMLTPVSGWLANRFGVKRVFIAAVAGFTAASMLCGVAGNLAELVLFRFAQGCCGAFAMPLSQAVLLDMNPPERHARAMAVWGMGVIVGPIMGPVVGGYITEEFSWRWCFYINLVVGALAVLGMLIFMPSRRRGETPRRFDTMGFASLIIAVAALQLMLDRGPGEDWFSSIEIWTEAIVAITAFWIFLAHTVTTPTPFIDLRVVRDRNLLSGSIFSMMTQGMVIGTMAILPIILQSIMAYPVLTSGLISMPRGLSMMFIMAIAPRLATLVDQRVIILAGLAGNAMALWMMAHFDLTMAPSSVVLASCIAGASNGLIFVPVTTLAFATTPPPLRAEAAAMLNLLRNLGGSMGVSVLQAAATANTQVMHASLAAHVNPSDPMFRWSLDRAFSPETVAGAMALDSALNREAQLIAYLDDFHAMFVLSILAAPLVLLLRVRKGAKIDPAHAVME